MLNEIDADQVRLALSNMARVLRLALEDMEAPELLFSAKDRVDWVARELEVAAGETPRSGV